MYERMENHFGNNELKKKELAWLEYGRGDKREMYTLFKRTLQEYMRRVRSEINRDLEEANMIPEISEDNLNDTYVKNEGREDKEITVHEFLIESPDGDRLIWSFANDEQGRAYIDNIYTPESSTDTYGTHNPKCNMGILVYKPTDYIKQAIGIPEEDTGKTINGRYVDIASYWEKFEPVKRYKEFLKETGRL